MKLKHLFLTFSFVVGIFSVAFAQQQQTALNVTTTSTLDTLDFAGREQARFVTNIANTGNDGSGIFIDNMQLQIPDGFDLVSLSLVKNETTLVSNTLSMQLNDTLRPSEFYTLDYYIRLTCDAIPTNLSNQFSVSFWNTLNINYTEHDTVKTLVKETDDFKLEVPSLSLTVGVGNANTHNNVKNIVWQTPVTDTFTIRNTAGAGSISNLRVSMLLMQNVDAFSDVKFSVVGGLFRNAEVEGGKYYIDLSSSDFQQAGLGDTFDANQQLNVVVSFIPTKFYLQTQAKYLAQIKNGSDECNEQINASAICDYHCSEPNVALSAIMAVTQRANYCEHPKTTYHVTGYVDECSDTEEHTITFVERLTQPQLILVVGADTITNGKIQYSDWSTLGEQIIHAESDIDGTLTPISKPDDNKCGIYEYQYTISNQCDSLATSITFEVENCDTMVCEDGDLVEIDGKPGYTLEDLDVLRGYVQNGATLQPTTDGGFTITIITNCGEKNYTLNSCFLENADINKDGVIDLNDKNALFLLIVEQSNK